MVLLTWLLIFFVISFGVCITIPAAVDVFSIWGAFHMGIALFLSVNTVFNFFMTVNLEGGFPTDVRYENCDPIAPFCPKCNYAKPARAHHCSTTGCCVLRMDHFCGFAQNCIGFGNHRHFLLFCFFIWLSNMYAVAMSIPIALAINEKIGGNLVGGNLLTQVLGPITQGKGVQGVNTAEIAKHLNRGTFNISELLPMEMVGHIVMLVLDIVCFCMISFLISQQWRLLLKGLTVIDDYQLDGQTNPFDQGWRKNVESVLGPNWWYTWMVPRRIQHHHSGMHYFPPAPKSAETKEGAGKITISTESDSENAPLVNSQPYI
jgi:palmitoyltransferase